MSSIGLVPTHRVSIPPCVFGVSKHTFKIYINKRKQALSATQPKKQPCGLMLEGNFTHSFTQSVFISNMAPSLRDF